MGPKLRWSRCLPQAAGEAFGPRHETGSAFLGIHEWGVQERKYLGCQRHVVAEGRGVIDLTLAVDSEEELLGASKERHVSIS